MEWKDEGLLSPMQTDWQTGCYSNPATEAAMERQKQEGYVNRRKHEPWKNWKIESENWLCLYDNCLSLRERRVVITESSSWYVRVR